MWILKIDIRRKRINPGDKIHRLENIKKIVSGMDKETCEEIKKVYDLVIEVGTYPVSSIKTAEAIKSRKQPEGYQYCIYE